MTTNFSSLGIHLSLSLSLFLHRSLGSKLISFLQVLQLHRLLGVVAVGHVAASVRSCGCLEALEAQG